MATLNVKIKEKDREIEVKVFCFLLKPDIAFKDIMKSYKENIQS